MTKTLTLDVLADAVASGAAGIRAITRLQPLGGPGDKVFPPTFGDTVSVPGDKERKTKYAVEERRIDGTDRLCVLLDSVASQANRFEEALQRAWDERRLQMPMVRVDFTEETDEDPALDLSTIGGDGYLSALEVPHRLADALLRDSVLGELRFRASAPGRAFTEASPHNAGAVYALCPSALVFGMWDSTGPKGGQGAKFQRALVSEIIGVGVALGRKTASRLDPAGIELAAGPVYAAADPDEEWVKDGVSAQKDKKGNPVPFSRKGKDKPGRPSTINHGNVTPSIDSDAGGVTMDYAIQTTVMSLPALRRLRFPKDVDGTSIPRERRLDAERTARTVVAALGLAAVALQRDEGFDLRSRCAFTPERALTLEVIDRDGKISGEYGLSGDEAVRLVEAAVASAAEAGMRWSTDSITLKPARKLVELIRDSRRVAAAGATEED